MTEEGFKRKLTAILSADVKDYSRLMEDDEAETVRTLNTYRTAISDLIQKYRGRVVDATGDNIMAEFTSVVDAVNCAVEIQRDLAERNVELAYERRMEFRIGVNLGDVIDEGGSIYGDGVNIAARVENLAEPGGICISGRAYDQVANKLGLEYENLGEHQVKNISTPIRVYRVLSFPGAAAHRVVKAKEAMGKKWRKIVLAAAAALVIVAAAAAVWHYYLRPSPMEPAPVEKAFPLPDKPSIAVLPFDNLSGDPEQEYFSDGMTDELISDLAKISTILVISRNSTFTYKGKQVKIPQIAKELNVRYVLEGSVQKSGDQVRIRAQLIDGKTDHHLWSESYDGVLADIFALQDKITGKIVSALAVKLSPSERERVADKGTDNVMAYEAFLKGKDHFIKHTPKDLLKAIEYYKEAIKFDPNFSRAYAEIGVTYQIGSNQGWSRKMGMDPAKIRLWARHYLELAMKNPSPEAYSLAAAKELHRRNFQESVAFAEKAYSYAPNSSERLVRLGWILAFTERTRESIELLNKSLRLDPLDTRIHSPMSFIFLGVNHFSMGNLEEAVTYFERALSLNPNLTNFSSFLAASHALLGHDIEAKKALAEYLKLYPTGFHPPMQRLYGAWPFKDSKVFDRFAQGLVKAGLRGDATNYYKLSKENKLNGQEIRKLMFGKTWTGYVWGIKALKFSYDASDDGEVEFSYRGKTYTGKAWIEKDNICVLREQYFDGLKDCREIYRNPEGDERTKTEYFAVTDYGLFLFSVEK
jgi:TolB-like protein/class 3 adenylate cyclase